VAHGISNRLSAIKASGTSEPAKVVSKLAVCENTQPNCDMLPSLLSYPTLLTPDEISLKGMYCYIIEHYSTNGIAIMIHRDNNINVVTGDWAGNIIDLSDASNLCSVAREYLDKHLSTLCKIITAIKIRQCIFYVAFCSDVPKLVDLRLSLNKFSSPGMLRDVFGKVVETQKVIDIQVLDDPTYNAVLSGTKLFSGDIILKPNRFRTAMAHDIPLPLYLEIKR
jgi:hypothetical protein